ncbi:hypothetical protein [Actibacterium sp. MT2.3-13A]|nr:hypothetical protein [Actibacterium sp. MT2.3-13A]
MTVKTALRIAACLVGLSVLTACATEEEIGECEPGVAEISEMATVTPPGC